MAGIKQEAQSDTGEEEIEKVRKAMAPNLTCTVCNGFYRGSVKYCLNNHGICSACLPNDKKQCPVTGCGQNALVTLDFPAELFKNLKLPVPCKFKKDGCGQENADEEVIAEHEIECGHRKVPCFWGSECLSPVLPAMELEAHIFSAHGDFYGKLRNNPGKWLLNNWGDAYKEWINSETGLRFWAVLYHDERKKQWKYLTIVFAGKNAAKKFRAEMRLSSHDVNTSTIFNGNVCCLDDWKERDASKEFRIDDDQFKFYNKGYNGLGAHNKDKNGDLTLPVSVKVKRVKFPCKCD